MRNVFFWSFLLFAGQGFAQQPSLLTADQHSALTIPFEQSDNTTATYTEIISFYEELAALVPQVQLMTYGQTDSGKPLHLAVLSTDGDFEPASIRRKGKQILMVNNAIHAGEPCGVDASMMLLRDYCAKAELQEYLENTVVIIVPAYNIGGVLNRNSTTRTNQNGPEAYGFRGNARNLDLNRDFIKCDSKNAQSFNQLFTAWQPDVFVDNHTSNGADYQYTITLIPTQHNKLNPHLANYQQQQLLPQLFEGMKARKWEMTPYVYSRNTPDEGIADFLDLPRYSSGYAALFNCLSFMPETHMLKPFEDRVQSTYHFMDVLLRTMHKDQSALRAAREKAIKSTMEQDTFALNWQLDQQQVDTLLFKGYTAKYKPSEISGKDRLYYDHQEPYEKSIPFYHYYKASAKVAKPVAYIIPQAYSEVINRLRWNGVSMRRLTSDQLVPVELYKIEEFKTRDAYEGHYLHYNTQVEKRKENWKYRKGDYVVYVNQATNRYIVETLEVQAPDSFFSWNFFDGILAQKEYFSSYVFEDLAVEILKEQPELKAKLEKRKNEDKEFAENAYAQLSFIYQNSPHYEPGHRIYPVGRIVESIDLKLE